MTGLGESATSVLTASFESEAAARAALAAIRAAAPADDVTLVAAAVVTLEGTGDCLRLNVDRCVEGMSPDCGGVLDRLFPPALLSMPPVGRRADAAADHYRALGIGVNLFKELGENLSPAGAAVLLSVREPWLQRIRTLLHTSSLVRIAIEAEPASALAPATDAR